MSNYWKKLQELAHYVQNRIVLYIQSIKNYFTSLELRSGSLGETNLKLGITHLKNGSYSDAILRFKIVIYLFKTPIKEAFFWLGITYFITGDLSKSYDAIEKAEEKDVIQLRSFLQECTIVKTIPENIWQTYRNSTASVYYNRFVDQDNNLLNSFIDILLNAAQEIADESSILDLGCGTGAVGRMLTSSVQKNFHLTGVENSIEMFKLAQNTSKTVYDSLIKQDIEAFLESYQGKKFEIITAFASLAYSLQLKDLFSKINHIMSKDGIFCLLLPTSLAEEGYDSKYGWFSYNSEKVVQCLQETGFVLFTINGIKMIDKSVNYTILSLRKK